jgi:hypothetical protein
VLEKKYRLNRDGRRVAFSIGPQEKAILKIIFWEKVELPDGSGIYGYRRYNF